jgi:hypothetical protein
MPTSPKPSPRWLYAFFDFIQRLPGPAWLLGLLIILTGSLGLHVSAWRQGLLPYGTFDSYLITVSSYHVLIIAAWLFLDNRARLALTNFFKKSNKRLSGVDSVLADFISLPSGLGTSAFLVGAFFGYFNFQNALSLSPLTGQVFPPYELLGFLLVGGLGGLTFLRAFRQAALLRRLYQKVEVNIFNPTPLYALTRYSSQSSLTLILVNYALILFSLPAFLFTTIGYLGSILLFGSALTLFFVPLGSINRRMRDEKERLLAELGKDLDEVFAAAHQAARRKDYARLDKMRNAASILKDGWEIVRKIPNWPWEPETVRNLLIPFLIPVIAFLVQRYLGSLLGG